MSGQNTKLKDHIRKEVEKRLASRKPGETTVGASAVSARPRGPVKEIVTWPEKFITGSTVYFSGRNVPITIHVTGVERVEVDYENERITVRVPIANAYQGRDEAIKGALVRFYVDDLAAAIDPLVRRYAGQLGMIAPDTAIEHLDQALGKFGPHGEIVFNSSLAYAPRFVLEYIVLHELAYRRIRNKEREFWRLIEAIMPDYRLRAEWLRQHAAILREGLPVTAGAAEEEIPAERAAIPQI